MTLSSPTPPPQTLRSAIQEAILANVSGGGLPAGTIVRESELARLFNTSREPVSSALQCLEESGVLDKRRSQGYRVTGTYLKETPLNDALLVIPSHLKHLFSSAPSWERLYGLVEDDLIGLMPFGRFRIIEHSMAKYYGVNRNMIQRIVTRLCDRGLTEKKMRSQCYTLQYNSDFVLHRYELRIALEPVALRMAADSLSPKEHKQLTHDHRQMQASFDRLTPQKLREFENQIHIHLLEACPNDRILGALRSSQLPLLATTKMVHSRLGHEMETPVLSEHLAVLEQLQEGQIDDAAKTLQTHLERSLERSLKRLPLLREGCMPELLPYLKLVEA